MSAESSAEYSALSTLHSALNLDTPNGDAA